MPNTFGSILSSCLQTGKSALDQLRSRHSHVLTEASGGSAGFALFGGYRPRHQFERLYLPDQEHARSRVVFHQRASADYCRKLAQRHGLVVFCGNSAPHELAPELLPIPLLVDMFIPVPPVLEGPGAPWSRWARANITKVKNGRFEFDVQTGDHWVKKFHRDMFRPTMRGRHGAEAYVTSRRQLTVQARTEGFELVRVLQDGKWVAGCVNQHTPEGYRMCRLGWLQGNADLLRSGVVSALYWSGFQRAAATGHQHLQTGGVQPFLEDGLLLFKARWGGQFCNPQRYYATLWLLLEPSHPACRRFLQTHTLLSNGKNQELIAYSGNRPDEVDATPAAINGIKRWYTWRDNPAVMPDVTADEVPEPLRPWLSLQHGDAPTAAPPSS